MLLQQITLPCCKFYGDSGVDGEVWFILVGDYTQIKFCPGCLIVYEGK